MVICLLALGLLPIAVHGENPPPSPRTFGLGMQAVPFPIFGAAVTYNPSAQFGLQAIVRTGIDVDFAAARALIRLKNERNYNAYLSALVGIFRDDDVTASLLGREQTDTAPGFGVGAGFEYFFSGLPSVGWSLEVDYCRIGFEDKWFEYDYETPQLIMLGLGINYYF